ncbi:hypothetical protein PAXINDRAFT_156406 [Paxillus involutus ATCC 200175]|uniref:Uncharacterized protein n=1 Tax=Paxillus involutus ATCC 200175 TaxID=664439 RepID=A0A0C9U270_PAXIN|nr:hypothetical protein PAXINDRAFT_156406 [Paxillus involutus ATCC 200175]
MPHYMLLRSRSTAAVSTFEGKRQSQTQESDGPLYRGDASKDEGSRPDVLFIPTVDTVACQWEADHKMVNGSAGHPERSRVNQLPTFLLSPMKKRTPVALEVDPDNSDSIPTMVLKGKAACMLPTVHAHAINPAPVAGSSTLPALPDRSDHRTFHSLIKDMAVLCQQNDEVLHPEVVRGMLMDLKVEVDMETQESFVLLADKTLMGRMTKK